MWTCYPQMVSSILDSCEEYEVYNAEESRGYSPKLKMTV